MLAALVLSVVCAPLAAEPLPRTAHVRKALAAVRELGPAGRDALDRAIYTGARTRCRIDAGAPAASCLITVARAACAADANPARCTAAADVVVANLRASTALVDEATRMRLVRGSADYRGALARELRQRYAILAAELALRGAAGPGPGDDDAAAIDTLCSERDRAIHTCEAGATACVASLPWSRCVAALVWFVGGSP